MRGINCARWIAGGIVAGIVMAAIVGASAPIAYARMQRALGSHNLGLPTNPIAFGLLTLGLTIIAGVALVFFYVAARTRFGAGPKTAVIVAIAAWAFGPLISSVLFYAMGMFGWRMSAFGLVVDLVAIVLASIAGAAVYREGEIVAQTAAAPA